MVKGLNGGSAKKSGTDVEFRFNNGEKVRINANLVRFAVEDRTALIVGNLHVTHFYGNDVRVMRGSESEVFDREEFIEEIS